ncbi:MAG TPA: hypothetical protein VGA09_20305 [Candidatus Binatia bacterium]
MGKGKATVTDDPLGDGTIRFAGGGTKTNTGSAGTAAASASGTAGNASSMTHSAAGSNLLKDIEKLRPKPYDEQTGKDITEWVPGATIGMVALLQKMNVTLSRVASLLCRRKLFLMKSSRHS